MSASPLPSTPRKERFSQVKALLSPSKKLSPTKSSALNRPPSPVKLDYAKVGSLRDALKVDGWQNMGEENEDSFGPSDLVPAPESPRKNAYVKDDEFEKLLDERDIPASMRDKLRSAMTPDVKAAFVKHGSPTKSMKRDHDASFNVLASPSKKKQKFSIPLSPTKKSKAVDPTSLVKYLEKTKAREAEVAKVHKLGMLLRNETIVWVDGFLNAGGFQVLMNQLNDLIDMEWREEQHDDQLLHEVLLCLKALCTVQRAVGLLLSASKTLIPKLTDFLFSKKQPAEYEDRRVIIELITTFLLSHATLDSRHSAARTLLSHLSDPPTPSSKIPLFLEAAHTPRPFKHRWCQEMGAVTRDVFWVWSHSSNIIQPTPLEPSIWTNLDYQDRTLAEKEAKTAAELPSGFVGSPEEGACSYMAAMVRLLNLLIASYAEPRVSAAEQRMQRHGLRIQLRDSGMEKIMGSALRRANAKYYKGLHAGLSHWVAMAWLDEWSASTVSHGPVGEAVGGRHGGGKSPRKPVPPSKDEEFELPELPKWSEFSKFDD
ncbi:hypothetical protein YB2330_001612 [Saitoella coloradoensis]